ncbi:hypothetical protein TNCV_2433531 [Trichonephila clavipes]|nr:hypothetical protein TNCV_2433531 [Trichonephila clavipes]
MSRFPDQVVSLKRDPQCLRPKASLELCLSTHWMEESLSQPCPARGLNLGPVMKNCTLTNLPDWALNLPAGQLHMSQDSNLVGVGPKVLYPRVVLGLAFQLGFFSLLCRKFLLYGEGWIYKALLNPNSLA